MYRARLHDALLAQPRNVLRDDRLTEDANLAKLACVTPSFHISCELFRHSLGKSLLKIV